jgi:hypothetical protein
MARPVAFVYLGRDLVACDACCRDADGGSTILGHDLVERLLLEYFIGGIPNESLSDLFPIAVLLIDHLGDSTDDFVAVHQRERLDASFGETNSDGLADTATGARDHANLIFYLHKRFF